MADTHQVAVEPESLRALVRGKYRVVATDPGAGFHFHTGRVLAAKLGYDRAIVDSLPDRAVESFAGVADPLTLRPLLAGECVVDLGSGAGFDCFVAALRVGPGGHVIGIDMTSEMLDKARTTAGQRGLAHVEFRPGIIEAIPVEDGWADVVMANGVLNLVADKRAALSEASRVLRPGGALAFADIALGKAVPAECVAKAELWTDCIAGGLSVADWKQLLGEVGFIDRQIGPPVDTFGGAAGEANLRAYQVFAHPFLAHKPR
ncbi:MAG TPA: methyltransferase domain-containing protein [Acidimicrobiales bacterium]|nr:methyltransferase domain-containing protein [Acidimicrobiales bacterium]